MSSNIPHAPTGPMPAVGLPDSQDYPRLVFTAPYFEQYPLAELIEPAVVEATENILPSLVPPYVDAAAQAAVQQLAVLLTGSTMSGPLFLSPLMPTQPAQAATMAYVDSMVATAGIPEVPPVPSGQVWARETGQWVPITPQTGVFLPLSGGTMTGNISMSGNTIQNMAAVPAMPNGAAPAQWVLNQIASVSLYQGTWDADTNVPDLTQLSTHVNAYTWIAITTAVDGVVIGAAIPGLQGQTIYNGDTIIYSTVQGTFMSIHAGGLSLPEADARYVQLAGSQMSGALLLNANASQPLQAVTLQQLQTFVPPGTVPEAPNDGQLYGRNGLTASWAPVLPLAGGILTGAVSLAGNATANLNPVPLQQMTSAISAATAGYLPLAGGAMTGLMTLSGNASVGLNPVPLQQLNSMLGAYAPLSGATFTGPVTLPTGSTVAGYLPLSGGTLTGTLTLNPTTGAAITANNSINITGGQLSTPQVGSPTGTLTLNNATTVNSTLGSSSTITSGGSLVASQNVIVNNARGASNAALQLYDTNGSNFDWTETSADGTLTFSNTNTFGAMLLGLSGNLTILGALTQGSDATNKTNISPLSQGISLVNQLMPKSYAWLSAPNVTKWGFIAQDVQQVIPDAVIEGTPAPGASTGLLGLDTTAILAAVVLGMKQLLARVGALETAANITPPAAETA